MTTTTPTRSPLPRTEAGTADPGSLARFGQDVFASLARADQRRCAEAYLAGLLFGTGRRSTRRMASELTGRPSGQALQQFVNQSPWNPGPVRSRIAERAAGLLRHPTAWVLDEVAFLKNGRHSVAVERQFVPSLGRTVNAQLAAALSLTNAGVSIPVDWRLSIPGSWQDDEPRRTRAHLPDHEHHRPYWHYLVDLVDGMTVERGLSARPVVADLTHLADPEHFLRAMYERGLGHLVRIGPRQPVRAVGGRPGEGRPVAEHVLRFAGRAERRTLTWPDISGNRPRSQFVTLPVQVPGEGCGRLAVVAEWPLREPRPTAFWLTSLTGTPLDEVVGLAKLDGRSRRGIEVLQQQFGLCDYEGRSFLGWHHHVTLATAAYLFHLTETSAA